MKLGSLFDGSGGFPLSGALCGIEPAWAAEVEPYPIAVTRNRFPSMKHLGDISKVSGADIEPVDIITFGSPCQDLSVAGLRKGLKHEANGDEETTRSGLFMEAVRIIKEMRAATNGVYPRFALWENVPGAFSSNKGEDFRIVCEELIKIVEPRASMPSVPQKGWPYSDSYCGDGWSLAYRVFDAQYWGVPQRRRRIHLVVDFRGECAGEVLFEREGVRGYFAEGRTPWQAAPCNAQDCSGADDREGEAAGGDGGRQLDAVAYTLKVRSGCDVDSGGKAAGKGALVQVDKAATLATVQDQYLFQPMAPTAILDNIGGQAEYGKVTPINGTLRSAAQGAVAYAVEPAPQLASGGEVAGCLMASGYEKLGAQEMFSGDYTVIEQQPQIFKADDGRTGPVAPTLVGDHNNRVTDHTALVAEPVCCPAVAYGLDRASYNQGQNAQFGFSIEEEAQPTLTAGGPGAVCCTTGSYMQVTDEVSPTLMARDWKDPACVSINYIVRRLTPTECARLQGFADWHGHLAQKPDLTDEEYSFWMDARHTYDRIQADTVIEAARRAIEAEEAKSHPNPGAIKKQQEIIARAELRKEKTYTREQMLTWYNKLWTDAAEYKMWGNGIALPPALYCMQGIVDAMNKENDDSWML